MYTVILCEGQYEDYYEDILFYHESKEFCENKIQEYNELRDSLIKRAENFCYKHGFIESYESGTFPTYWICSKLLDVYVKKIGIHIWNPSDGFSLKVQEIKSYEDFNKTLS